ncbi:MAG: response regulator transcription factor [Gaiellaceae bacterium]
MNSVNGKRKVAASQARNGRPSVVLAETDVATRLGIRMALEGAGIRVAAEVDSANAVVDVVAGADACLISVNLPGGGIQAAAAVIAEHPDTAVIMLTGAAEGDELVDAVRVGAVGYIVTDVAPTHLPEAINAVLRGEVAIPRLLVSVLADRLRERLGRRELALRDRPGVELTTREWEVLDFMCDGLSTREIAGRLLISEITVRRHISAAMKKLHVGSRGEAVKLLASA